MRPITAKRTPQFTGPAGWNAILPTAQPRAAVVGDLDTDVAIIGAGYAGLAAARRLRQLDPQLRVIIVDAAPVGVGGTGRNSGFMIDLPHELTSSDYAAAGETKDRVLTRLNRHAIAFAADAVAEYGISAGYFQKSGKINGAASDVGHRHNVTYAKHLATLGEAYELYDAQQMAEITGTSYYSGGLFTPGTAMIQPAGFARGLADGLERQGVTIFENSPVTRIESLSSGWKLTCPQGAVSAQSIILANNGHLESFGFYQNRLMHIMLNACMTQELSGTDIAALGGHYNWGITPADPMGSTVRRIATPQGGNRIVIRQGAHYRPEMVTSTSDLARVTRNMRQKFDDRFPTLKHVRFEHAWSGHLCLAKNGASVMQEIAPRAYAAAVQNGLGTTRGTLSGIGAAELVMGKTSDITAFFAAEPEPSRLPPHPFDTIGANAYLRWKEWQARRE